MNPRYWIYPLGMVLGGLCGFFLGWWGLIPAVVVGIAVGSLNVWLDGKR